MKVVFIGKVCKRDELMRSEKMATLKTITATTIIRTATIMMIRSKI